MNYLDQGVVEGHTEGAVLMIVLKSRGVMAAESEMDGLPHRSPTIDHLILEILKALLGGLQHGRVPCIEGAVRVAVGWGFLVYQVHRNCPANNCKC
jgi:hypothetical protein